MKVAKLISLALLLVLVNLQIKAQSTIVTYYFVELIPNESSPNFSPEQLREIQTAHMGNIKKMAQEGKLLLAGPFEVGGGLFVLNAKNEEEAEAWVESDPAVKAQRFVYTIRKWFTEKGMLTLESVD